LSLELKRGGYLKGAPLLLAASDAHGLVHPCLETIAEDLGVVDRLPDVGLDAGVLDLLQGAPKPSKPPA
jgi:hypothetical protein